MKLRVLLLLSLPMILMPAAAPGDAPTDFVYRDNLIVPGYRIGPVHPECSREELSMVYGERKLEDMTIDVGEGTFLPGTVIKGGSDVEIHVIWMDESMEAPAEVWAYGDALRTDDGIGIGTTLQELEDIIGPFDLMGFAWDYQGTLFLEGTSLEDYAYSFYLRLAPSPDAIASEPDAYDSVMGDDVFSSSDPSMQILNPAVYDIGILFY